MTYDQIQKELGISHKPLKEIMDKHLPHLAGSWYLCGEAKIRSTNLWKTEKYRAKLAKHPWRRMTVLSDRGISKDYKMKKDS